MKPLAFAVAAAILLSLALPILGQDQPRVLDQVHANLDWVDPSSPELGTIQKLDDWKRRRDSIRKNLEVVMGTLPDRSNLGPVAFDVLEETPLLDGLIRRKIQY
ncbi:MAG: hypothetical protein ACKOAH_16150, partial [Pirellula sp.]